MKTYTEFVTRVYATIMNLYEADSSSMYGIFAEGFRKQPYSQSQEYAILSDEYAKIFIKVLREHLDLLEMSETEYQEAYLKSYPKKIKVSHSCYPKNVKRWLSGTISRKRKCRMEFCVLVWCHAMGWNLETEDKSEKMYNCQQNLKKICDDYLPQNDTELSFEMLWKTSNVAYFRSI